MSDTDATQARQDVVTDIDEIIEYVINANRLSMPYDVYSELFDAIDGLGVKVEKLQDENAKLRELVRSVLVLRHDNVFKWLDAATAEVCGTSFTAQARELGVEM